VGQPLQNSVSMICIPTKAISGSVYGASWIKKRTKGTEGGRNDENPPPSGWLSCGSIRCRDTRQKSVSRYNGLSEIGLGSPGRAGTLRAVGWDRDI